MHEILDKENNGEKKDCLGDYGFVVWNFSLDHKIQNSC